MLQKIRRRYGKFEYLWFLEFQKRGAIHYHVLTTISVVNGERRKILARDWVDICGVSGIRCSYLSDGAVRDLGEMALRVHSNPKAWELVRDQNGAAKYVTKYALSKKKGQKIVPDMYRDVGRFWGFSSGAVLDPIGVVDVTEDDIRDYLLSLDHPAAKYEVLPSEICIFGDSDDKITE